MRRAFTILELLVASLLLGMLVSILTMLFNQSSISWRTGVAGVADLDLVRNNIAEVREEADNAYIWNDKVHRIVGLWDDNGALRSRAWDVDAEEGKAPGADILSSRGGNLRNDATLSDIDNVAIGSGASGRSMRTYTINVKSAGPNKAFNDYDDVWSYPDEIN